MRWLGARHELVVAHFEGRTTPAEDRRMWRHLPGCEACRRRYRDLALLEALEPDAEERSRRRLGRALFAPPRRRFVVLGGLSLAVAVAGVVLIAGRLDGGGTTQPIDYIGVRGTAAHRPSLAVYRRQADGHAEALGGPISRDESLAFAYVNPHARPSRYLMVFAVDEARRVYWYWPAWRDPAADPVSIPISPSAAPVELREAVKHPFSAGRVTLFGLFTDQPYRVTEVEKIVAAAPDAAAPPLGGQLWRQTLEVTP